jgi:uncharacterized protein
VIAFIADLNGQNLENYAIAIARAWGIGQKEQNNGILILIVKNDRKIRIELGYGIEGIITDMDAKYLIDKYLQPNFRLEKYAHGLDLVTDEMIRYLAGQHKNNNPRSDFDIEARVKKFWYIYQRSYIFAVLGAFF